MYETRSEIVVNGKDRRQFNQMVINPAAPTTDSSTQGITIHCAAEGDALSLAQNESDTLNTCSAEDGPSLMQVLFGAPTAERVARRAKDIQEDMHKLSQLRTFKAVVTDEDQSLRIVGLSCWHCYTQPFPVEDSWQDRDWEGAANPAACNEFVGAMARNRTKYMGGKRFIWLETLTVNPAYQRRGIGWLLIRAGLAEAERLGLDEAYVESSPSGYQLYRKWGFEPVDTIVTDKEKYGGKGIEPTICMIRKAVTT